MRKGSVDVLVRVRLPHRVGELAKFATAIAGAGGVIGEVSTERIGEPGSVRTVTLEADNEAHAERLVQVVRALPGVEVLEVEDRVFEWHRAGKLRMVPRAEIKTIQDLRYVYTPGVARVCRAIERAPESAWDTTDISRTVGIFTNGTRVLGLGDIGPLASLPVMEGKALLYAQFVGLTAVPILVDERDPAKFVSIVERVSQGFGAIHLEDIRVPDCFTIERELIDRVGKPVFHDDQHGTATVALAGIINACNRVGLTPGRAVLGQIGLGAAGSAIAKLAKRFGFADVLVTDRDAGAVEAAVASGCKARDLEGLMADADIVVAATGRPGLIRRELVRKGQIIFALSNPDPEILPELALAAGAAFAGDGRSVNNALAFPGIIRAVLATKVRHVTPDMLVAAAEAIAACAMPGELVPSPLDPRVHDMVSSAVAVKAGAAGRSGTIRLAQSS